MVYVNSLSLVTEIQFNSILGFTSLWFKHFDLLNMAPGSRYVETGSGSVAAPAQWLCPGPCKDVWAGGEGAERTTEKQRGEAPTVCCFTTQGKSSRPRRSPRNTPTAGLRFRIADGGGSGAAEPEGRDSGAEMLVKARRAVAGACPPSLRGVGA